MHAEVRTNLAKMQAELVSALVRRSAAPAGFDPARVRVAAESLATKRARSVTRAWPALAGLIPAHFPAFVESIPLPQNGGPLADGRAFARWLEKRGELPDAARLQTLAFDLRFTSHADARSLLGWQCIRVARLRQSRRIVLAFRLPLLGEHWLNIPWGRTKTALGSRKLPGAEVCLESSD